MITREEQYLNRLAGETEQAIPEPETRKEQYLSRLCGADNIIPEKPITREEQYLASLCGEEVEMPEPETRLEQYMAFAGGERESKPEPITRKEQLWDKYQGGGVIEYKTVTGEVISVSDAVEAPAVKLKVTIEPKQEGSGDPSPENIRAITGWTGATATRTGLNQWDEEWEVGSLHDTTGQPISDSGKIRSKNFCNILPSTIYYAKSPESIRVLFYDAGYNFIGETFNIKNETFTSLAGSAYFKVRGTNAYGNTYNHDICINIHGDKDGTYEPYVEPTTATTAFGRTVYGGTVDLITGELVVDKKCYIVTGSEPTPTEQGSILIGSRNNRLRIRKLDDCEAGLITSGHISNIGVNSDVRSAQQNSWKLGDFMYDNQYVFVIIPSEYTTFETGLAYIASLGAIFEYSLAEPQTYTLTPQQIQMLEGSNTVWVELINEDTTTQTATSELTYKSRAAQRVLAMNNKLSLNKQALEIKRNGGAIIDKPIIKPIGGGAKL